MNNVQLGDRVEFWFQPASLWQKEHKAMGTVVRVISDKLVDIRPDYHNDPVLVEISKVIKVVKR